MGDDVHSSIASSAKKAGEKNRVGNECDRPALPFESQVRRLLANRLVFGNVFGKRSAISRDSDLR
jgi:hypothetical protein